MRISDWSSDVCSSDLQTLTSTVNLEKVVRGTDLSLSVSSPRELAAKVDMLQENIKIVAQRDNLFKITATSSDTGMSDAANAKMATAVVQKLIDIFVEENMAGDRQGDRDRQSVVEGKGVSIRDEPGGLHNLKKKKTKKYDK